MKTSLPRLALFLSLAGVLASSSRMASAGDGAYHDCKITNGHVFSCEGGWYQGHAVVLHDGAYHDCKITNGQVFSCEGGWYQGHAVVLHDGAYHDCKITNGQVFSCEGSWYQGHAVVQR